MFLGFPLEGGWAALSLDAEGWATVEIHDAPKVAEPWAPAPSAEVYARARRAGFQRPAALNPEQTLPGGLLLEINGGGLGRARAQALTAVRGADRVRAAALPSGPAIELGELWLAPDQRSAVVELRIGEGRSLLRVDLREATAKLEVAAALRAMRAGAVEEAAARLEAAVEAAPQLGEPYYDLACLHALLGDLARSALELKLALAIDAGRFGRLAKSDPDLAELRESPDLWASLIPPP